MAIAAKPPRFDGDQTGGMIAVTVQPVAITPSIQAFPVAPVC